VEEKANHEVVIVGEFKVPLGAVGTTGWTLQLPPTPQGLFLFVQTAFAEFVSAVGRHRHITWVLANLAAELVLQEGQHGSFDLLQFFFGP